MAIEICIISTGTHTQMIMEGKGLIDHILDTLEHFCQINESNKIGWLFLTALDKVGEEKDKLGTSDS